MSAENKKTPAEGTGVSGMLATASLAVAESDVKSFLENILASGNHALVTKQGNGMHHEWSQTADGLIKLIDLRTDNWFSPAAFSGAARRRIAPEHARCGWTLTLGRTTPSLTILTRSSSPLTTRASCRVPGCPRHG